MFIFEGAKALSRLQNKLRQLFSLLNGRQINRVWWLRHQTRISLLLHFQEILKVFFSITSKN